MRGSIAIWHDARDDGANGYAPRVEIHVNIWKGDRRNISQRFHLFDIGFRFKEIRSLQTLSISLPFVIQKNQIVDLFSTMHDSSTLSAIFNETLSAGEFRDGGQIFAALDERQKVQFYVSSCSEADRSLATSESNNEKNSIIMVSDRLFDRLRQKVGDHYFRLRVRVPFDEENSFISDVHPKDSAFLSTISAKEIVEFRLNERRNFSTVIREKLSGNADLIDISAVHYFLIRDMTAEMTQSHTSFKKMRRLEPGIWDNYLRDERQIVAKNMIIYHWDSHAKPQSSVESFTALATFRAYYTGPLTLYAVVVILLGAMGSALQAILTNPSDTQVAVILCLVLLLYLVIKVRLNR